MAPLRGIDTFGDTKICLRFEKLCFSDKKPLFQEFFLDLGKVLLGLQVTQLCGKSVLDACVIRVNTFFRENTLVRSEKILVGSKLKWGAKQV